MFMNKSFELGCDTLNNRPTSPTARKENWRVRVLAG